MDGRNKFFDDEQNNGSENFEQRDVRPAFDTGFSFGTSIGLLGDTSSSAVIATLKEVFEAEGIKDLEFNNFDNQTENTNYSVVTISKVGKATGVKYYVAILLERTGKPALTFDQITTFALQKEQQNIFTLDAMFDLDTMENMENRIAGDATGVKEVGSMVVSDTSTDGIKLVADMVYKLLTVNAQLETHQDLVIDAVVDKKSKFDTLEVNYRPIKDRMIKDRLGNPVRADFELSLKTIGNGIQKGNSAGGGKDIIKIYGYMDYEFGTVIEDDRHRGREVVKAFPNITITSIDFATPSLNFALLGLVVSTVMTNEEMLIGHMLQFREDIAPLNLELDMEGKGKPRVLPIDKLDDSEIRYLIMDNIQLEPAFFIDIEHCLAMEPLAPLLEAIETNEFSRIVEAANVLTSNRFSAIASKLGRSMAIVDSIIEIPRATYTGNGIVRDYRDYDLSKIITVTKDVTAGYKWTNILNSDNSFIESVLQASELSLDGQVISTISRISLSGDFLGTLYSALEISNLIRFNAPSIPELNRTTYSSSKATRMSGRHFKRHSYAGDDRTVRYSAGRRY